MVWACFTSRGTGALHIIDEQMEGEIMENALIPSANHLFKKRKWTLFQQDNDHKYRAHLIHE